MMKLRKLDQSNDQGSTSNEVDERVPWNSVQFRTNDGLPAPTPVKEQLDDDLIFEAQHHVSERNVSARHALQIVLTIVVYACYHGPSRGTLLAGLVASTLLGGCVTVVLRRGSSLLSPISSLVDGAINAFVVFSAPELFPYVAGISLAQFGLAVVSTGAREAVVGALPPVVAYPLANAMGRVESLDFGLLGIYTSAFPLSAYLSGRIRSMERSTRKKYLELLGELEAVVWEADPKTMELTFASSQTRSLFGVAPTLFIKRWLDFVHPDDREQLESQRRGAIESGEDSFGLEHRMVHRDGDLVYVKNTFSIQYDGNRKPMRVRGAIVDVTRQQEAENTIRKQAQYDTLTGLPNRSLFNDQLKRRLDDVRRTNEGLAVLLLDLNGFKEVNDTLGHAVGDQLLQAIAGRLAAYLPERSLVARLGGDEFAVMVHPSNPRSAGAIAETIASCLQPPITVDSMTIQAGASTGIALYPQDGDSPAVLLRRADAAMYEAKQSGRSHMFATPDDDEANVRRLQLLGELRASIATGDFRLYHQPKIDLRTGAIVGTEGLIRWQHRQFGVLSPAEFVELTELSGLIQPLTRWVIEQGIRDLADWRRAGLELMVALNLSVRNFFDQGLPAFIAQLLQDYNVPGDQLVLEITEREVMADRALARTALSAFRELGVKISIDDFGTGFSSLSQLQLLPIDEIKVDQSFVSGMLSNPQDGVIVRSIIDLGRNLDLEVVAEGAEEVEQIAALRDLGADRAQGYFISRPLPGDEFKRWLTTMEKKVVDGKVQLVFPGAPLGDKAPGRFGSSSGRVLVAAGSRSTDSKSRVAVAVPGVEQAVSSVNMMPTATSPTDRRSESVMRRADEAQPQNGAASPPAARPASKPAGLLVTSNGGARLVGRPDDVDIAPILLTETSVEPAPTQPIAAALATTALTTPKTPPGSTTSGRTLGAPQGPTVLPPKQPTPRAPQVPIAPVQSTTSPPAAGSIPVVAPASQPFGSTASAPQVPLSALRPPETEPQVQAPVAAPPPAEIHSPFHQVQMSSHSNGLVRSNGSAPQPTTMHTYQNGQTPQFGSNGPAIVGFDAYGRPVYDAPPQHQNPPQPPASPIAGSGILGSNPAEALPQDWRDLLK